MANSTGQDLFRDGIAQFKSGNYQEALKLFLGIIDQDKKNHKAWNALGVVYTRIEHFREADDCFVKALSLAPDTAPYLRNLERNRMHIEPENHPPSDEDSSLSDDWLNKARILREKDNYEGAMDAYDQVTRIHPGHGSAWHEKGEILWSLNRFDEALESFNQAIRYDPQNFIALEYKARILHTDVNRLEESVPVYDQAIKALSAFDANLYQKGLAYDGFVKFDIRDESLQIFDQAIRNIRFCYQMLHNMGDVLYQLGRFEEAIQAFDQAIKLNMELAWASYCQGSLLSLLPKEDEGPEEGIIVFNNAHENFEHLEKTYYLKGLALGRLGKFEEAIETINQAVRIDPKYADAVK